MFKKTFGDTIGITLSLPINFRKMNILILILQSVHMICISIYLGFSLFEQMFIVFCEELLSKGGFTKK